MIHIQKMDCLTDIWDVWVAIHPSVSCGDNKSSHPSGLFVRRKGMLFFERITCNLWSLEKIPIFANQLFPYKRVLEVNQA